VESFRDVVIECAPDGRFSKFILHFQLVDGYLRKPVKLAYCLLVFSRYFKAFKVLELKGRGGWHDYN
jgi:hypothetical protein